MNIQMSPEQAKDRLSNFRDKNFRQFQESAVRFATESDKKIRVIDAPTGSGKTLIGMVAGVIMGECSYLCSTRMLQSQIAQDFAESKVLWGRANYICLLDKTKNCDQCSATKTNPCQMAHRCLYKVAKKQALDSPLRTLNYSYLLAEIQFAGRFSGTPFTVIDECDALESVLINTVQLSFTERSLFRLGLQDGPSRKTVTAKDGIQSWREFGTEALNRSGAICKKLSLEIDSFERIEEDYHFSKLKELAHFTHMNERCQTFLNNVDQTWVLEQTERQGSRQAVTTFRPLWLTEELASKFLWSHSDSFLLMSATVLPKIILAKTLGLDVDEIDWMTIPSSFPIERRPIHVWPVAEVTNKKLDEAVPKIVDAVRKILSWHPNEKGLIQGVSYSLCKRIFDGVNSNRLVTHNSGDRQDILDTFVATDDNTVMLSPSMERGVSLDGSKCAFIICVKAPYLSLMDRIVSQRLYSSSVGQVWYRASMMMAIVQSCGRGMRSKDDHCICYLIDSKINEVYMKHPSLWPDWFKEAVTWDENKLLED